MDLSYSFKKFQTLLPYCDLFTLEKSSARLSRFSFQA